MFSGVHGGVWLAKRNRQPCEPSDEIIKMKLELDIQFGNEIQKREAVRDLLLLNKRKRDRIIQSKVSKYKNLLLKIIRNKELIRQYIGSLQYYNDNKIKVESVREMTNVITKQSNLKILKNKVHPVLTQSEQYEIHDKINTKKKQLNEEYDKTTCGCFV